MEYRIRAIKPDEYHLLNDFLYEAIFVPQGVQPPAKEIIDQPQLQVYVADFGQQKDDHGLVAVVGDKIVGAVWVRIMEDYGHVDDATPSFAISVYKEYRGHGIGTELMKRMLLLLKEEGYQKASLAVQKANYALKMYLAVGFTIISENEEEYIMVCDLTDDNKTAFRADQYDKKVKQTLPYYEEFYQQVMSVVESYYHEQKIRWLDVGCGTGKMAEYALAGAPMERYVFNDCSPAMLAIAKERFTDKVTEFDVTPVQELKYQEEFDVITAIQVNHYLDRTTRTTAIKRCFAALKQKGILISFENFAPFSKAGEKLFLERWKSYQLEQGRSIAECEAHLARYNKDYYPISITEHLAVMKEGGFEAVEILWVSHMQVGIIGMK